MNNYLIGYVSKYGANIINVYSFVVKAESQESAILQFKKTCLDIIKDGEVIRIISISKLDFDSCKDYGVDDIFEIEWFDRKDY